MTVRATSASQLSLLTLLTRNSMVTSCGAAFADDYHNNITAYNALTNEERLGLYLGNLTAVLQDGLCQLAANTICSPLNRSQFTSRFNASTIHHNFDKPLFLIFSQIFHQQADYSSFDEANRYISEFANGISSIQVDQQFDWG
jgi:hypothetical protein